MSGVSQLNPVLSSSGSEVAHSTESRVKPSVPRSSIPSASLSSSPSASTRSITKDLERTTSTTASTVESGDKETQKNEREVSEEASLADRVTIIAKLRSLGSPTFHKFFKGVRKHVEATVALTQEHIVVHGFGYSTVEQQRRSDQEVIRSTLEGDILFRPCIERWKMINAILQIYRTRIDTKTLDAQTNKIQQLQVHLNFLIKLQQNGGVAVLMDYLERIQPKYKFKKLLLLGLANDQNEQRPLISLLRVTMSVLQNNLSLLIASGSTTLDTRTRSIKESAEEKKGYKSPAPSPVLAQKNNDADLTELQQRLTPLKGTRITVREIKPKRQEKSIEAKETAKSPPPSHDIPRKRQVSEGLVSGSGSEA